jgi:hypothetical protein
MGEVGDTPLGQEADQMNWDKAVVENQQREQIERERKKNFQK